MPQKLALMLDDQMLSFAEVMHCVQRVAIHLTKSTPPVKPNDIVYQMLQRSLDLPIGYFAILTTGGVYCAFNPTDSSSSTDQIIEQTGQAQYVLVHEATDREMYVPRADHCLQISGTH